MSHSAVEPDAIAGIGVSGLFPTLLLADKTGRALRPALLYSDNRATEELKVFNEHFNLKLTSDVILPKMAWLRSNEPEVFLQARYLFTSHNYVSYRLTGAYCLDYKVADSLGGLLDRTDLKWREDMANWAGVDIAHLPRLCSEVEIIGEVTKDAAGETGLKSGIPVITGSGDSLLAMMGSGVTNQGDALLSLGTTGWMGIVPHNLANYFKNPRLISQGAPYLLEVYLLALGSALQWYRDQFAIGEKAVARRLGTSAYHVLDDEAAQVPSGSDGLIILPYFLGGRELDMPQPETASIFGLTLSHTGAHVYRALLESFGYVVRSALERLDARGTRVRRIVITGGGASSVLWRQIVSDIIEHPLYYYVNADPCLGSAYLVGYALGFWDSLERIRDWLHPVITTQPSEDGRSIYDESYSLFMAQQSSLSI
jgi:xylulokinase